ncbi:MMPL family transporter [Pirellulales bacterium]|nr:MMPL family transporter [Pirellulales bacterium]
MAAAFLVALMPRGARKAIESNTNKAEDWLPKNYPESVDLRWFRDHFLGEQFALVSWKDCTLGNAEKLHWLARKLSPTNQQVEQAGADSELATRSKWYKRVVTGPGVLEELTSPPVQLSYNEACRRLEGALIGPRKRSPDGKLLGNETRTTCLMIYLSEVATRDNVTMRKAIELIREIAVTEGKIPEPDIHMGGPPVDNIQIDIEGERTLFNLALLAGIVGLGLSYWCFRSMKLTGIVFAVGVMSAGMSLAIVFYFGVIEVWFLGLPKPRLGAVDAILMSMPAVVYVLGLSGAIHTVNYYRDARREHGLIGAAETAVRLGWWPCTLAAFTTAIGLGSLYASDILPIKKFGLFTGIAVLGTVVVLFTVLPVFLHRFPISDDLVRRQSGDNNSGHLPLWARRIFGWVIYRNGVALVLWLAVMTGVGYGLTKIETTVQLLKLLDEDARLIHDYAWLEENLGNLVPMEVVLTIPPERRRSADEHAESDGEQYRMTMLERLELLRTIQARMEELPEISRVLSVATFAPKSAQFGITTADMSGNYTINKSLEEHFDRLLAGDFLRIEKQANPDDLSGRELWRISARVAALSGGADDAQLAAGAIAGAIMGPTAHLRDGDGVDYGQFVEELKWAVDPVLWAYAQRDLIVKRLHASGKQLEGARLVMLYRSTDDSGELGPNTQERLLSELLLESRGRKAVGVERYNLATFDNPPGANTNKARQQYQDRAIEALIEFDAMVLVSAGSDPTAKQMGDGGLQVIDVSREPLPSAAGTAAVELTDASGPRPIRAVFTGMVPVVYKTQRQLLFSLRESIGWATVIIAGVMMFVLRSPLAGLISMIPNVFPIVIVFGALGWLGIKVDIGIMMTASVALGVAVDDTVHFLTWFRRGVREGLNRVEATKMAYERCAKAMMQTTIIGGLGLSVFATSSFTPTQQFGYLMITMLGAALVGDLLLLPAILAGPLGRFFGGESAPLTDRDGAPLGWHADVAIAPEIADAPNRARPAGEAPTGNTPKYDAPSQDVPAKEAQADGSKTSEPLTNDVPPDAVRRDDPGADPSGSRPDLLHGPHAELHAKLRRLRREQT